MARKSLRLSNTSATAAPSHKRGPSATEIVTDAKRTKNSPRTTPKKSQYFATKDDLKDELDDEQQASSSAAEDEDASDFEDGDGDTASSADENQDEDYDSEDEKSKRKKRITPQKKISSSVSSTTAARSQGQELWRPGVKTGLGPGKQVIIKKPKARPAGKTPYADDTIHPNTMLFLAELKENNQRHWLKMHDPDFRQAEKDWFAFVEHLTGRLIDIDDTIPELPVKDVIFRIYRDVRFSPDPTPYKPQFSAAWSRTGRKGPYAHYYVQIGPHNDSFVDAAPTAAMRRAIDRNPRRLKDVLIDDRMRKEFFNGVAKNDAKAVKAFAAENAGNALKTKPKGYDADHADIELLKLRNYTVGAKLREQDILGGNAMDRICQLLAAMKPFISYINSVVMPDMGDQDGSDNDDDDDDQDDEEEGE